MRIPIKPLSVNRAWQGKRFKTPEYKTYEQELLLKLPRKIQIPEGKLEVILIFGVSSKLADWDNPIKPFVDILQKKYEFDDRRIYKAVVKKVDVGVGEEYVEFHILSYSPLD